MEGRGEEFLKQAEDELKRFAPFSGTAKKAAAAALFTKAGNAFKSVKQWEDAGNAFVRAGSLQKELREEYEMQLAYTEAAKSFRKGTSHDRSVELLNDIVIPNMLENGKHGQAAKLYQEIAEMCEEDSDFANALANYQRAADLYVSENSKSAADKCLVKIAMIASQDSNYDLAVSTFEDIANHCLESNLLKFNAKGYLLSSMLCVLAKGDLVLAERKLEQYKELDYTMAGSRECKLAEDVTRTYNDFNADEFTDVVYAYDQISKLDPWKTTMLLRIKNKITEAGKEAVDLS